MDLIYNGGAQTIWHVPPVRVASATYVVEDLTEDEDSADRDVVASGAATVDAFTGALTAAAGRAQSDPRLVTHDGGAATVGREYQLQTADGRAEQIAAEGVTSTTIRCRWPISSAFPAASSILGLRLTGTIPSGVAADTDLYDQDRTLRVTWTYTLRDRVIAATEILRLIRSPAVDRDLGWADGALREAWPELVLRLPPHGNAVRDVVRFAARRLDARLRGLGIDTDRLWVEALGRELLLQRCVLHLADQGFAPDTRLSIDTWRTEQEQEFARLWMDFTRGRASADQVETDRITDQRVSPKRRSVWGRT